VDLNNKIDYNNPLGIFVQNAHTTGDLDLYSKQFLVETTYENEQGLNATTKSSYSFKDSPFSKFKYGIKLGVAFEVRGFQLGLNYSLQLSNMANDGFWESSRIPVFNKVGANNMSGYKHRINALEIKIGYIFRY